MILERFTNSPCEHCKGTGKGINHKEIGQRLRKRRMRAILKLREVAGEMGISVGYLSDLEQGRKHWSQDLIDRNISAAFAVSKKGK